MAKPLREIVPLNELSKKTLTSYQEKAHGLVNRSGRGGGRVRQLKNLHPGSLPVVGKTFELKRKQVDSANRNLESSPEKAVKFKRDLDALRKSGRQMANRSLGDWRAEDRLSAMSQKGSKSTYHFKLGHTHNVFGQKARGQGQGPYDVVAGPGEPNPLISRKEIKKIAPRYDTPESIRSFKRQAVNWENTPKKSHQKIWKE